MKVIDGMPMISIASTSWLTRIAPSWATIPPPTLAARMNPNRNGTISRLTQNELKIGPVTLAPSACPTDSAAIPHATPADEADEDDHERAAGDEDARSAAAPRR